MTDKPPVTDPISVRFDFDPKLFPRALTAWWMSAVPRPNFVNRVIFWTLAWGGLLMVTLVLGILGIAPVMVGAGVIGAACLVLGFMVLQRVRMRRFAQVIGRHWDQAGESRMTFSADGVDFSDAVSKWQLRWPAIDAIASARGGTVLRIGVAMLAIPDRALPDGLRPRAFREQLEYWRDEA